MQAGTFARATHAGDPGITHSLTHSLAHSHSPPKDVPAVFGMCMNRNDCGRDDADNKSAQLLSPPRGNEGSLKNPLLSPSSLSSSSGTLLTRRECAAVSKDDADDGGAEIASSAANAANTHNNMVFFFLIVRCLVQHFNQQAGQL